MKQPSLPPRGIFIPTHLLFSSHLSPAIILTWIQLRALAWDGWITPPLSMKEISTMLGKSQKTILTHLSKLNSATGVAWQAMENGSIIVSFPTTEATQPGLGNRSCQPPPDKASDSQYPENSLKSYFPPQIMGYITYNDDIDRPNMDENT